MECSIEILKRQLVLPHLTINRASCPPRRSVIRLKFHRTVGITESSVIPLKCVVDGCAFHQSAYVIGIMLKRTVGVQECQPMSGQLIVDRRHRGLVTDQVLTFVSGRGRC